MKNLEPAISISSQHLALKDRYLTEEVNEVLNHLFNLSLPIHLPAWLEQGWDESHFDRCYGYAYVLFERKRYAEAKALLGFLARLAPQNFEVTLALGCCAQALGSELEALAHFYKAAQWGVSDPRPYFHMGEVLEALGRTAEAWVAYDHTLRLAYATPEAFLFKTEAESRAQRLQAKLPSFQASKARSK